MGKYKKFLCIVISVLMIVSYFPIYYFKVSAASAVEYSTIYPEYVILNVQTGNNSDIYDDFVKGNRSTNFYNAIKKFGMVYTTKNKESSSGTWSNFTNTNLYKIADVSGLKIGISATFNNDQHSHSWWGWKKVIPVKYSQSVISYQAMKMSFGGSMLNALYGSSKKDSKSARIGDTSYVEIPKSNGTATSKNLVLSTFPSTLSLGNGSQCTGCEASIEKQVVCFYDNVYPYVESVVLEGGADGKNFKAGDTIKIKVTFSEPMRFSDDSKNHGDAYIQLMTTNNENYLNAYLKSLKTKTVSKTTYGNTKNYTVSEAVFEYTVPSDSKLETKIEKVNLDSLKSSTKLIHVESSDYIDYSGNYSTVYSKNGDILELCRLDHSVSGEGYTTATSPFVDIAGNSLGARDSKSQAFGQYTVDAYIDCVAPTVEDIKLAASLNNGELKKALYPKVNTGKGDKYPGDNSDLYIGVGDSVSFTASFSECLVSSNLYNAVATTNLYKNGQPVKIKASASASGTKKALDGKNHAASLGQATFIGFEPIVITSDMICSDGACKIKITSIDFNSGCRDASSNQYVSVSVTDKNTSNQILDTKAPIVAGGDAPVQRNSNDKKQGFYYKVTINDQNGSGVEGVHGQFTLSDNVNSSIFKYKWSVSSFANKSDAELEWKDGLSGKAEDFIQHADGNLYFYVKFLDNEKYSLAELNLGITAYDYAGNKSASNNMTIAYEVDDVAPEIKEKAVTKVLNNQKTEGSLSIEFSAYDINGFNSQNANTVEYVWTSADVNEAPSDGWGIPTAVSSSDGGKTLVKKVSFSVSAGDEIEGKLWVRATDVYGNSTQDICLGTYSYNLKDAVYSVSSSSEVSKDPYVNLTALGNGDAVVSLYRTSDMLDQDTKLWFVTFRSDTGSLYEKPTGHRVVSVSETDGQYTLTTYSGNTSSWINSLANEKYYGNIEAMLIIGKADAFDVQSDQLTKAGNGSYVVSTEFITIRTGGDGSQSTAPVYVVDSKLTITEADGLTRYKNKSSDYSGAQGYELLEAGNTLLDSLDSLTLHISLGDKKMPEWGVDTYDFSPADDGISKTRLEIVHFSGSNISTSYAIGLLALSEQDVKIPSYIADECGSGEYLVRLDVALKSGRHTDDDHSGEGYYTYTNTGSLEPAKLDYNCNPLIIQVDRGEASADFGFYGYWIVSTQDPEGYSYNSYVDTEAIIGEGSVVVIDKAAHLDAGQTKTQADEVYVPVSKTVAMNISKQNTGAGGFLTRFFLQNNDTSTTKHYAMEHEFIDGMRWAKITNTADGVTATKWAFIGYKSLSSNSVQLEVIPAVSGSDMETKAAACKDDEEHDYIVLVQGKMNVLTIEYYNLNGQKSETKTLYVNAVTDPVTGSVSDIAADPSRASDPIYSVDNGAQGEQEYTQRIKTVFTPAEGTDTDGLHVYIAILGKQVPFSYDEETHTGYIGSDHTAIPDDEMTLNADGSYSFEREASWGDMYSICCYNEKTHYLSNQIINTTVTNTYKYGSGIFSAELKFDDGTPTIVGTPTVTDNNDGTYSITLAVKDSVIDECGEMKLVLKPTESYAAALGLNSSNEEFEFVFAKHIVHEGLTVSFAKSGLPDSSNSYNTWEYRYVSGDNYGACVWKLTDDASSLGVFYAEAEYRSEVAGDESKTAYITIKGAVPSWDASKIGTGMDVGFTIEVEDRFKNRTSPVEISGSAVSKEPTVLVIDNANPDIEDYPGLYHVAGANDYVLKCYFTQPVTVKKSWACLNPSNYAVDMKVDELPVTKDGDAVLELYDVFGVLHNVNYNFDGIFNITNTTTKNAPGWIDNRGHSVEVTISETEPTNGDVTISIFAPTNDNLDWSTPWVLFENEGTDDFKDAKNKELTVSENGAYKFKIYYNASAAEYGNYDTLTVYIDNIIKDAPTAEPFFYFSETGEGYKASELPNRNISGGYDSLETSGNVTVSYVANRNVVPVDGTSLSTVFKYGGETSCLFKFEDELGNAGSLSVDLAQYGIVLSEPKAALKDENSPTAGVNVYIGKEGKYERVSKFTETSTKSEISDLLSQLGYMSSLRFSVGVSDESSYKMIITKASPASVSYATAQSENIDGISLSGCNITVAGGTTSDSFFLTIVDNAAEETNNDKDNFVSIEIPVPKDYFDTTAPVATVISEAPNLYDTTVIISVSDKIDNGTDITDKAYVGSYIVADMITPLNEGVERISAQGESPARFKYVLKNNGSALLSFADAMGNIGTVTVSTNTIDDTAPELSVEWTPCATVTDPVSGKTSLIPGQVTSSKVNTDVIAVISSTKDIKDSEVKYIIGTADAPVTQMPSADDSRWDKNNYGLVTPSTKANQLILTFSSKFDIGNDLMAAYGIWAKVTLTAPNGKSVTKVIGVPAGIIDGVSPFAAVVVEPLTKAGATLPYAYKVMIKPAKHMLYNISPEAMYYVGDTKLDADGNINRTKYTEDNPYTVVLRQDGAYSYAFTDEAGNKSTVEFSIPSDIDKDSITIKDVPAYSITVKNFFNYGGKYTTYSFGIKDINNQIITMSSIDAVAPKIAFTPSEDEISNMSISSSQDITVSVNEACRVVYTINGKDTEKIIDNASGDSFNITLTKNGVLAVTATDASGNETTKTMSIGNLDDSAPVIVFDNSTIQIIQDAKVASLSALLDEGVHAYDVWNGVSTQITPSYDMSAVKLDTIGIYPVTYTAIDSAGNTSYAVRNVTVYDKYTPMIIIDGEVAGVTGFASLKAGVHSITVTNLEKISGDEQEPYKMYIRDGMRTIGQMKDLGLAGLVVNEEINLTQGYYTIYVITQSRHSYKLILFVEK